MLCRQCYALSGPGRPPPSPRRTSCAGPSSGLCCTRKRCATCPTAAASPWCCCWWSRRCCCRCSARSRPGQAGLDGLRTCVTSICRGRPSHRSSARNRPPPTSKGVSASAPSPRPTNAAGEIVYPPQTGAIQLRPPTRPGSGGKVWVWPPGATRRAMAPFEVWFWRETLPLHAAPAGRRVVRLPHGRRRGRAGERAVLAGRRHGLAVRAGECRWCCSGCSSSASTCCRR